MSVIEYLGKENGVFSENTPFYILYSPIKLHLEGDVGHEVGNFHIVI